MRKTIAGWFLLAALAGILGVAHLPSQAREEKKPAKTETRTEDRKAIEATMAALTRALGKGDAKAVGVLWTAEGEYRGPESEPLRGREAITRAYGEFLKRNPGLDLELKIDTVRFLGSDTALVEGQAVRKAGKAEPTGSRFSALLVREKGRWLHAALREWAEASTPTLADLEWMVGTWSAKVEERTLTTTYEWMEGKGFLRGTFTITEKGKPPVTGMQVIGQDAAEGVLRSWVFEAGGGFGQGTWRREEKRWMIDSFGTTPDGTQTMATQILTPLSKDAFTWQSVERLADGEKKPDVAPIKITRVKKSR